MKKTKKGKTLTKAPEKVKWPLKKFLNKFFIYNLVLCVGIAMLVLSLTQTQVFNGDQGKIMGNIIASALTTFAGLAGGLIYSLLLTYKGEKPYETTFSNLTKWFFWVPVLGIVFDKIWKSKELKVMYAKKLKENPNFKKPKKFLPNAVSLIFVAMVGMVFLIWILYLAGVLVPDASKGEAVPGILDIFLNPLRGFAGYKQDQGGEERVLVAGVGSLVIFLFMFNATMTLINDSRAIEAGIGGLLKKMKGKEIILIPILMLILGICGSTFNMCEQLLPLFLIIMPIMFAAGYDSMTGFLMINMSAGVGVMASTVNPVLIGTAVGAVDPQWIAANPDFGIMTGITWRLVLFAALMLTVILCTVFYARKVKKNPQKSCVYMSQAQFKEKYSFDKDALPPMTSKRKWSLIVFGIAFLMLIVGFVDWQTITGFNGFQQGHDWLATNLPFITSIDPIGKWGMVEGGMLFFIAALVIGAINWKGAGHFFNTFYEGCRQFIGIAFIISVAKGLAITMTTSGINGMIASGLGGVLGKMPAVGAMIMIFLVIAILTFFIPSSSGLASAMMPTISGSVAAAGAATVSMSGAITTFASAMGWVNLFTPTGMVMPFCEVSKIDYGDFIKSSWKHLAILLVVGLALMAVGCYIPAGMY